MNDLFQHIAEAAIYGLLGELLLTLLGVIVGISIIVYGLLYDAKSNCNRRRYRCDVCDVEFSEDRVSPRLHDEPEDPDDDIDGEAGYGQAC